MQNKEDVDNDIVKLKLFSFFLGDRAKTWFSSLPKIVLIHGISVKMLLFPSIFLPLRSSPLGMIL